MNKWIGIFLVVFGIMGSSELSWAIDSWISCSPAQVMVFTNSPRLHVKCAAPIAGVSFFAVNTSDSARAARFLSLLNTAQVAGRTLSILYDTTDTSGTSIGCQAADCRLIKAVGFGN